MLAANNLEHPVPQFAPPHAPRELPATITAITQWLVLALDEVDYGVLLLGDDGQVLHINHAARAELDDQHPLQMLGRGLRARDSADVAPLAEALQAAQRGLRRLLVLGSRAASASAGPGMGATEGEANVAVVPLGRLPDGQSATLLMLGKRAVCEPLSVQWFARSHALTPAESRVLEALCRGLDPREVAEQHKVGLATVRTQIGNIRAKTGAESIRDLVRQVALLPPMLGRLRMAA